jgi:hypothetical protein
MCEHCFTQGLPDRVWQKTPSGEKKGENGPTRGSAAQAFADFLTPKVATTAFAPVASTHHLGNEFERVVAGALRPSQSFVT